MTRPVLIFLAAVSVAVILHAGCGSSGATGTGSDSSGSGTGTNSISGTVQAPTIGIFGDVSKGLRPEGLRHKATATSGVADARICAYNLTTGVQLGCATSDSSGNYTISNLLQSSLVDPNNNALMRVVLEATTSDGQAVIYDYEDTDYTATLNAGTADAGTTNAFVMGILAEMRKIDGLWKVGTSAPQGFVDKLTGNTFDPACGFAPFAAMFADSDVAVTGEGIAGSVGLVAAMLEAAIGHAVWNTLSFSSPADFIYAVLNNQLTEAQISAWADAVADDIGVAVATLTGNYTTALGVLSALDNIYGSVLASDVGLTARTGRNQTLCARLKSDATTLAGWVDTLIDYSDKDLLEDHWGSATAMGAAAKFIEEFDDDDMWSSYQPEVMIGLLGTGFNAEELTDARVSAGAAILSKGTYSDLTSSVMEDVGTDLWKFLFSADSTELAIMDDNPAFWAGYVLKYYGDMTGSSDYSNMIDHIIDDADDVDTATCASDPKACVTSAGAESPSEAVLSNIAGHYSTALGSASGSTCAAAMSCTSGTLAISQSSGSSSVSCTYVPSDSTTQLTGTGSVSGTSSWSCSVSRATSYSGCDVTESYALSGAPSPISPNATTVTLTRATGASAVCDYVIGTSVNSCSFSCSTTMASQ